MRAQTGLIPICDGAFKQDLNLMAYTICLVLEDLCHMQQLSNVNFRADLFLTFATDTVLQGFSDLLPATRQSKVSPLVEMCFDLHQEGASPPDDRPCGRSERWQKIRL